MTSSLPSISWVTLTFKPSPVAELQPQRRGRIVSVDVGPTLWIASYQSAPLTVEQAGIVGAWYDSILSYEPFYAYDLRRPYPIAYRRGWPEVSPPFDGMLTLVEVADDLVTLTLTDAFPGMVLSVGDYVAWDYGPNSEFRALHRVHATATAGVGGSLLVEVRPEVRAGWELGSPSSRPVILHRPAAKMIINPGSWDESTNGNGDLTTIGFEATQTL